MMTTDPAAVVAMLRRGDVAAAGTAARNALRTQPEHLLFLTVAGLAALEEGRPADGAGFLARALALRPSDLGNRINLARALVDAGDFEGARTVAAEGPPDHPDLLRLGAWAAWQGGDAASAAARYGRLVAVAPATGEDWNNLGNARDAAGDLDGAIAALTRAAAMLPTRAAVVVNLARALARARRHAEAREPLERLLRAHPGEGAAWLELGLVRAAAGDFGAAEVAYGQALSLGETAAALELGLLYESENRVAALQELASRLDAEDRRGDFVRALAARRAGRLAEARRFVGTVPDTLDPVRYWQLLGELEDRLDRPAVAFAAFERMNAAATAAFPGAERLAALYREEVDRCDRRGPSATAPWRAAPLPPAGRPTPAFIVGFPRSGTTLLDTCLSNLPSLDVVEERPMLREVEVAGGDAALHDMDAETAATLRTRYFAALDRLASGDPTRRAVDKFPLHMARIPLVHRLFPDAKIILVERHPCDVVLSCFVTNFDLNPAMANFLDLASAARLYDQVWTVWERARSCLPLDLHVVRYERLIEAPEDELRAAVEFLGERWDPSVLDHRGAAARRGHIATASYAQITEPLYRRSLGRWTRYRPWLEPVLPILAPWCERMGYSLAER
jgi:tetratricopeptide (TPR) repeat protein